MQRKIIQPSQDARSGRLRYRVSQISRWGSFPVHWIKPFNNRGYILGLHSLWFSDRQPWRFLFADFFRVDKLAISLSRMTCKFGKRWIEVHHVEKFIFTIPVFVCLPECISGPVKQNTQQHTHGRHSWVHWADVPLIVRQLNPYIDGPSLSGLLRVWTLVSVDQSPITL